MPQPRPLSIIANRISLDQVLECGFIRDVLLSGLRRPWRFVPIEQGQRMPLIGDSIYLCHYDDMAPTIRAAVANGCRNVGAFHMADEIGQCDHSWYPFVDYVIRNYWYPQVHRLPGNCRCRKVMWVPNGYRYGIGPRDRRGLLASSQRPTHFFFAGFLSASPQAQADRTAMLDVINPNLSILPAVTVTTAGFGGGLGPGAYGGWMEATRFALCPRGRAPETIRLFDALELGAIPVSLRHDFLAAPEAMAGSPIVQLDSWRDLITWYPTMADKGPEQLDELQRQCLDWWDSCKARHCREACNLIEQSFAAGEQ